MKKIYSLVLPIFLFLPTFLYLHQKVQIHVEAYQLSSSYNRHNELVAKRDYLMYNFAKQVSLPKVNKWAEGRDFVSVEKERIIALNTERQGESADGKIGLLLDRFLRASIPTSAALASEED